MGQSGKARLGSTRCGWLIASMKRYFIIAALSGAIFSYGQQSGAGAGAGGTVSGAGGTISGAGGTVSGAGAIGTGGTTVGAGATTVGRSSAIGAGATVGAGATAGTTAGAQGGISTLGPGASSISTPGSASSIGLSSANTTTSGRAVPFNTLPVQIQTVLRQQAGGNPNQIGPITQVMTPAGPVYTVSVVRNGTPTTVAVQPNGTLLNPQSVSPVAPGTAVATPAGGVTTVNPNGTVAPTAPGTATASRLSTAQAGLPVTALPPAVQTALRGQLAGSTIQTISRDDTANGPLFRVTVNRNGVPTELQFAANGALLAQAPLTDSLTSPSGAVVGTVPPAAVVVDPDQQPPTGAAAGAQIGTGQNQPAGTLNTTTNIVVPQNIRTNKTSTLKLGDLPEPVAATLREEAPDADIRAIYKDERPNGEVYRVAFRSNDRFGELVIDEEGNVVRDSRDTPVVVIARDNRDEARAGQIDYARLPVAVKNAIRAYASPTEVRSVRLARSRDGKTVYDVVIYEDGRRNRLEVSKDGTLTRFDANVSSSAEGATDKAPIIALGDLPQEVQDTIRRQTDTVRIQEISTTTIDGDNVYQVKWETNGAPVELLVASDGALIYPTGATFSEEAGEAAPAPLPNEEDGEVVKTVDASKDTADLEATGAPAATSTGASSSTQPVEEVSSEITSTNETALKQVSLEDVPQGVQNTVKKLGGSSVVQAITPKVDENGMVYEVTFMQNGAEKKLTLDKDGAIRGDAQK